MAKRAAVITLAMIPLDPSSDTPLYRQLYSGVRRRDPRQEHRRRRAAALDAGARGGSLPLAHDGHERV